MSEQPKWTPGPWTVTDCDNAGGTGRKSRSLICSSSRPSVDNPGMEEFNILAEVIGPPPVSAAERKANARLIAAAPELYDALLQVLKSIASRYYQNIDEATLLTTPLAAGNEFVLARNALAKARGDA